MALKLSLQAALGAFCLCLSPAALASVLLIVPPEQNHTIQALPTVAIETSQPLAAP